MKTKSTIKSLPRVIASHTWNTDPIVLLTTALAGPIAGLLVLNAIVFLKPILEIGLGIFLAIYLILYIARIIYLCTRRSGTIPCKVKNP